MLVHHADMPMRATASTVYISTILHHFKVMGQRYRVYIYIVLVDIYVAEKTRERGTHDRGARERRERRHTSPARDMSSFPGFEKIYPNPGRTGLASQASLQMNGRQLAGLAS